MVSEPWSKLCQDICWQISHTRGRKIWKLISVIRDSAPTLLGKAITPALVSLIFPSIARMTLNWPQLTCTHFTIWTRHSFHSGHGPSQQNAQEEWIGQPIESNRNTSPNQLPISQSDYRVEWLIYHWASDINTPDDETTCELQYATHPGGKNKEDYHYQRFDQRSCQSHVFSNGTERSSRCYCFVVIPAGTSLIFVI